MRFLCMIFSAFLLSACGRADASNANYPSLTIEYLQADSARVIAKWSKPCDSKGCADSYVVKWGALLRASREVTRTVPVDTYYVTRPAIGDSLQVSITVTAMRRSIASAQRSTYVYLRNPDAPPPPVDSLKADTLSTAELALLDSFPTLVVRDESGMTPPDVRNLSVGETYRFCVMGRNRYTGEVRSFVSADAPPTAEDEVDVACFTARAAYAAEKSG